MLFGWHHGLGYALQSAPFTRMFWRNSWPGAVTNWTVCPGEASVSVSFLGRAPGWPVCMDLGPGFWLSYLPRLDAFCALWCDWLLVMHAMHSELLHLLLARWGCDSTLYATEPLSDPFVWFGLLETAAILP